MRTETQREYDRVRKQQWIDSLTPEHRAEIVKRRIAQRSAKRAAIAIAEGRVPGKPGKKALPLEQKKALRKASYEKWRKNNLEKHRVRDAELARKRRAEKAITKGRQPGKIGRERIYTKEQILERTRKRGRKRWQKMSAEERFAKRKAEYERNIVRKKRYYQEHKEQCAVIGRNYRARKVGNGGTHTKADIRALFFEQNGLCGLCDLPLDANKFHVDHWKPLAKGGSNDKSNLKLLHPLCNLRKSNKLPQELGLTG